MQRDRQAPDSRCSRHRDRPGVWLPGGREAGWGISLAKRETKLALHEWFEAAVLKEGGGRPALLTQRLRSSEFAGLPHREMLVSVW
jgi:hypothetical protein